METSCLKYVFTKTVCNLLLSYICFYVKILTVFAGKPTIRVIIVYFRLSLQSATTVMRYNASNCNLYGRSSFTSFIYLLCFRIQILSQAHKRRTVKW